MNFFGGVSIPAERLQCLWFLQRGRLLDNVPARERFLPNLLEKRVTLAPIRQHVGFCSITKKNMANLRLRQGLPTQRGMLTPAQLRAARALVGWSRETLAEKAGVSAQTVTGFELLSADSRISTLHKMRRALETAGIRFIDEDEEGGPGVRLQKGKAPGKRK